MHTVYLGNTLAVTQEAVAAQAPKSAANGAKKLRPSVIFKPGLNQLDPKLWAAVKVHPDVKAMLDDEILEVIGKESDSAEDLAKMDDKKALKLVADTMDHTVLVKWYAAEKRDSLQVAIRGQLEKLNMDTNGKPLVIDKKKG